MKKLCSVLSIVLMVAVDISVQAEMIRSNDSAKNKKTVVIDGRQVSQIYTVLMQQSVPAANIMSADSVTIGNGPMISVMTLLRTLRDLPFFSLYKDPTMRNKQVYVGSYQGKHMYEQRGTLVETTLRHYVEQVCYYLQSQGILQHVSTKFIQALYKQVRRFMLMEPIKADLNSLELYYPQYQTALKSNSLAKRYKLLALFSQDLLGACHYKRAAEIEKSHRMQK
ncbi:MAG: hypothetical protein CL947_02915 [Epsilonproteobacteria bacterium]|nr:hypothetical protein [Campylobacterota bacterium]|tara:strand:- start:218 stop:889 length:672 start_codon:yes stop_codon:yes gene_type:complete